MSGRRPVAEEPCTGAAVGRGRSPRRTTWATTVAHPESRNPRPSPEEES